MDHRGTRTTALALARAGDADRRHVLRSRPRRSTETRDREEKMPLYAREGVSHLWLVNPTTQTLEAFVLDRERWVVLGTWSGEKKVRIEPFDAIELDLAAPWSR